MDKNNYAKCAIGQFEIEDNVCGDLIDTQVKWAAVKREWKVDIVFRNNISGIKVNNLAYITNFTNMTGSQDKVGEAFVKFHGLHSCPI